jgi:hypothetical protein
MDASNRRPDVEKILKHCRSLVGDGSSTAETTIAALCKIRDGLAADFHFSRDQLQPIDTYMDQLQTTVGALHQKRLPA